MDNDFTVNAALIAAIAAIVAPTITTLINRIADIQLKKLEVFQNSKRKAYDDFAESFSLLYHSTYSEGDDTIRKILSTTYQAMTYSSAKTRTLLKEFSNNLQNGHWESTEFQQLHEQFFACIDAMKNELYKIK